MALSHSLLAAALLQVVTPGGPGDRALSPSAASSAPSAAERHDGASGDLQVLAPVAGDWDVRIDGRLNEAAWANAPVLDGFTQYEPVEGIEASQRTEVRVLISADAILFGIRAHDDQVDGIRSTLSRRDGFGGSDDWVRVVLDTYNDQRRGFVFQVNPQGIQGDGLWVEGRGGRGDPIDWNPDFIWASAGRVDQGGYTVEFEVPFKSLRFPDAEAQDWGLQVVRRIQRAGFSESWAPVTSNQANRLAQSGSLRGLESLDPGLFLEVNPVLTASRVGAWDDVSQSLRRDAAASDFGFNLTYGLTSNLTLDGTYNPDFSQVEADAGQITVNERFALRLNEKRPFFLEGTDVFNLPQRIVYTRSIVNPVGAAKMSGKVGGTTVAYIGAVDEVSSADNPMVNLLRLKHDVGSSSSLGMVYTDRTTPGQAFNRVAGADGRFVIASRYTVDVMAAASADGVQGEDTRWGSLFSARFNRSSRKVAVSASFQDITPDFLARSGFIRQVGITEASARTGYTWRGGRGALLESVGVSVEAEGTWERDDFWSGNGPEESDLQMNLSASLRGNIGGFVSVSRRGYSFADARYNGLFVDGAEGLVPFRPSQESFSALPAVRLRSWISTWDRVRGSFGASWSETPIFDRGVPTDVARNVSADVGLTLFPTGSLSMEVGARHVRLTRKRDGSKYSTATIPRLQGRYQFTRSLFVRGIGEYSSQERRDVLDPETGNAVVYCSGDSCSAREGRVANDFRIEALMGYEPSPGTVLFVGYARAMRDAQSFRFDQVRPESDGVFAKLSYRFRM